MAERANIEDSTRACVISSLISVSDDQREEFLGPMVCRTRRDATGLTTISGSSDSTSNQRGGLATPDPREGNADHPTPPHSTSPHPTPGQMTGKQIINSCPALSHMQHPMEKQTCKIGGRGMIALQASWSTNSGLGCQVERRRRADASDCCRGPSEHRAWWTFDHFGRLITGSAGWLVTARTHTRV